MAGQAASLFGALVAIAALGCATAGEDPGTPIITKHDGGHDGTFGDGTVGDGSGHDGGPLFEGGTLCGDVGSGNTCEAVTDLGSIAVGDKKTASGNVPLSGGEVWYRVTFLTLENPKAHPHVVLSGPDAGFGFLFEVVASCAREDLACGAGEDASSAKTTDFEDEYAPDDAADGATSGGDAFIPITLGKDGTIYLRVFRTGGTPTACDGFTLDISN